MRPSSCGVPLALLLLVTASVAAAQPAPCQTTARRIELAAGGAAPPEICISPGLSTTVLFDWPLARDALVLEGRERFRRVDAAGSLLVLVPSEKLQAGERLSLKVRFTEADGPESASFVLVVYRDQAERQIEVSRPARAADSCQTELARTAAELRHAEVELQRCRAQGEAPSPHSEQRALLAQLLEEGSLDETGVVRQRHAIREQPEARGEGPQVIRVTLYRSSARLAVAVELSLSEGARPWRMVGASLLRPSGDALQPWIFQATPLAAGSVGSVWVEIPREGVQGVFTLELWDEGKAHTLTVPGLKFP